MTPGASCHCEGAPAPAAIPREHGTHPLTGIDTAPPSAGPIRAPLRIYPAKAGDCFASLRSARNDKGERRRCSSFWCRSKKVRSRIARLQPTYPLPAILSAIASRQQRRSPSPAARASHASNTIRYTYRAPHDSPTDEIVVDGLACRQTTCLHVVRPGIGASRMRMF